jgi:Resolvase, N terminal domain
VRRPPPARTARRVVIIWKLSTGVKVFPCWDRKKMNPNPGFMMAGAGFRSLKDPWADTTTLHRQLMLTILGGLAEFERTLIRSRTGEGRERAKARGVRFGRPKGPDCGRGSRRRGGAHVRNRPRDRVSSEAVAAMSLLLNPETDPNRMIEQVLSASKRKR